MTVVQCIWLAGCFEGRGRPNHVRKSAHKPARGGGPHLYFHLRTVTGAQEHALGLGEVDLRGEKSNGGRTVEKLLVSVAVR